MQNIRKITAIETFLVRNPVLRAGKPIQSCIFLGDDLKTTSHFGFFIDEKMVGVSSLFQEKNKLFDLEKQFQIRGMAVLENFQKKGIGNKLVKYIENHLETETLIWFNARIIAVDFYEKLGYQIIGNSFEIDEIGKHFVMCKILKK